jgi:hypothetical protein
MNIGKMFAIAVMSSLLSSGSVYACACGCSVFDIGGGTIMPVASDSGFSVWFRYAYMNQDQLREGSSRANSSDNPDKQIITSFYIAGAEYMINHKWTVMAQLPLYQRSFTTTDDGTYAAPAGTINTRPLTDLGDVMVRATYTGFSPNMATGLSFGVKLPTGRYTGPIGPLGGTAFDRDTLPGTGSTDLVAGGYHVGKVSGTLSWFAQTQYQFAIATRDDYRPGNELDGALGLAYDFRTNSHGMRISPILQLIGSVRNHDTGGNADPDNTGYKRLLIAPGVQLKASRKVSVYTDVEFPVAQHVRSAPVSSGVAGQLTASALFKVQVNYGF